MNRREIWVDNVKVVACILVTVGHFYQGVVAAGILPDNDFHRWFDQTIYFFHVPLFFICSGYLYQKAGEVNNLKSWLRNVAKKFLDLGVPYFTFSIITWVIKAIFNDVVNTSEPGFFETLFLDPAAPYWYLYILFFMFVFIPAPKTSGGVLVALFIGLAALFARTILGRAGVLRALPYVADRLLGNSVWFVLGMALNRFRWNEKVNGASAAAGLVFLPLSVVVYLLGAGSGMLKFFMGILGCFMIISVICYIFRENKQAKAFSYLSRNNMPIFLMHTIFAAGTRIILLKIGISNAAAHMILGLTASFAGPVFSAWIMERTQVLNFFMYPMKFIKLP